MQGHESSKGCGGGTRFSGAWRRRLSRGLRAAGGVLLSFALLAGPTSSAVFADSGPTIRVIVTATDVPGALAAISSLGLSSLGQLPLVGGVVTDVTQAQLASLAALPGINVSPDLPVTVAGLAADAGPRSPAAVFPEVTGATGLYARGVNGSGVNVAVLDTGIDALPDFAGRLVGGVDLSGEGNPFQDNFGHGTFVAGLVAGNGASSGGLYHGEAPGAGLVSIKVAGRSGVTDVAGVIGGVEWAILNQALLNISVLNMSLGSVPVQSTAINPLDRAVEAAWHMGITVVASAGNGGPFNGTVLSPGDDPLIVTSGAIDDNGTASQGDDTASPFSGVGPTNVDGWVKPDLATSGRSVVSLRAPGSTIDVNHPSARIGTGNFVGSGTSFSAAITSGAAALVIQQGRTQLPLLQSGASPDAVKGKMLGTTTPGPVGNPFVDGHGELNVYAAALNTSYKLDQPATTVSVAYGTTVSLHDTWSTGSWNPANWEGVTWTGGAWNGGAWNGGAWNGGAWNGAAWNGGAWNGGAWNGAAWNGGAWNGGAWNGGAWNGGAWNGGAWNGGAWNGGAWNGGAWNGGAWNGGAWNGGAWNGSDWA